MIPQTTKELRSWFEKNFQCVTGFPGAYFQIPLTEHDAKLISYTAYAVATEHRKGAQRGLIAAVHDSFSRVLVESRQDWPLLFWRTTPQYDVSDEQHLGELALTYEEYRDGTPVPAGAVQGFDSRNWYKSVTNYKLSRLYLRLNIPIFDILGIYTQYSKSEGTMVERI